MKYKVNIFHPKMRRLVIVQEQTFKNGMATQRNMFCSGKQESSRVSKVLNKNKGIRIDQADIEDGNAMLKMYTDFLCKHFCEANFRECK